MSISEKVTLDTSDAVSSAGRLAAALGSVSAKLQGLGSAANDLGAVASKMAEVDKISAQAAANQLKAANASVLASQKSAQAESLAALKGKIDLQKIEAKQAADIAKIEAKAATVKRKDPAAEAEKARKDAEKVVKEQERAAKAAEAAAEKAHSAQMQREREGAGGVALALLSGRGIGGVAEAVGLGKGGGLDENQLSLLQGLGGALSSAASEFLGVAEQVAAAAEKLLEAGARLSIQETSARETSIIQLQGLLGSEQKAEDAYTKILDLANDIGLERADALSKFNRLVGAGFGEEGALAALRAVGDVTAVVSEAAGTKLNTALVKIQAAGKVTAGDIKSLRAIGIDVSNVYENIAKSLGKTSQEAASLVKAGQVSAEVGQKAIEAAVQKQYGGLGVKLGETLPRILGDVQDEVKKLFDQIDLSPLKDALKNIFDLFKGPEGAELKKGVEDLFGSLFHTLFDEFKGPEGKKKLADMFHQGAEAAHEFAATVRELKPLISFLADPDMIGAIADTIQFFIEPLKQAADVLKLIAGALKLIQSLTGTGVGGAGEDLPEGHQKAEHIGPEVPEAAGVQAPDTTGIGKDLIGGMTSGVTAGAADLATAVVNAITGALNAGKAASQTHSPSMLFHNELGFQFAAGAAQGVMAGTPLLERAVGSMVGAAAAVLPDNDNAAATAALPDRSAGAGGSAAAAAGPLVGALHVEVTAAPGASAEQTGEQVGEAVIRTIARSEIARQWRRAAGA